MRLFVELVEVLACRDEVLEADLGRVHAEGIYHLVHGRLDGKATLCRAIATEGAWRHRVGVADVVGKAARHLVVDGQGLFCPKRYGRRAMVAIGTGIGEEMKIYCCECAVTLRCDFHREIHLVAGVRGREHLLACQDAFAGVPGLYGCKGSVGLAGA